jgi:hypothetical protein
VPAGTRHGGIVAPTTEIAVHTIASAPHVVLSKAQTRRVRAGARWQTLVLCVLPTHDHLATSGGPTPVGRLFLQTHDHAYRSPVVVRFLRVLLCKIAGKLFVIWDGAPIPRPADQGLPRPRRCQARAPGTVAGLRSRAQPSRRVVELPLSGRQLILKDGKKTAPYHRMGVRRWR